MTSVQRFGASCKAPKVRNQVAADNQFQKLKRQLRLVYCAAIPAPPKSDTRHAGNNGHSALSDNEFPPPPPTPQPIPVVGVVSPASAYDRAVGAGTSKAQQPWHKIVVMGIMAGIMIGYGGFLAASIGGACPGLAASNPGLQKMVMGAFGLPFGLLMVLVCGADLFTGNTAVVTAALHEGKVTLRQLFKSWTLSYIGNFIGSLLLVGAVSQAGMFAAGSAPAQLAVYKTSHTFLETFMRGILCNFLVCIGVWQATAANSLSGKAIGVWFPISAFVAMGLEHSVANMFLIPMGMALGAPVSISQFLTANLIPVTLGNIVGGAIFVGTAYAYIFGRLGKK
eukprot:CAMPEP_0177603956 /NCGR_PEP_ID=MMETSP0419_2-20121207/15827_1 /TAXON_ID=582737 /ORGANISM="Tetraselmis sp., Strain GSL018" /LENGTH=337 /DNA_ID=CAMNT_0019097839 /DNA_START=159 /DNA_END=1172 /DNA_ORIENTATION=-